jgi:hypothetical protein
MLRVLYYMPSLLQVVSVNRFGTIDADGARPFGSLPQSTDNKLYGLTSAGGDLGTGIAFSFDIVSSLLVKLLNFGINGFPIASFIQGADGFFTIQLMVLRSPYVAILLLQELVLSHTNLRLQQVNIRQQVH